MHKKCVNADINASVNIAKKVKGLVIKVRKVLSFVPSHNGVFAITPHRRGNALDPAGENPP